MIDPEIRDYLSYDPETGEFTWLKPPRRGVAAGAKAGSNTSDGYLAIRWRGARYKAHRLAWWFVHGELPSDASVVDHINGITLDNRICNLRLATTSQNHMNKRAKRNGTSPFKGVTRLVDTALWQAHIRVNGKQKNLGKYLRQEDAARAYDAAARAHFGEFARLNFPGGA